MRSIRIAIVLVGVLVAFAAFGGRAARADGSSEPLCEAHSGSCLDTRSHKSYEGDYVGHDEPSLLFYSNQPGSGYTNVWHLQIPKDAPVAPIQLPMNSLQTPVGGTWNFQLRPTFWFGMAVCDTQSYPNQNTVCPPDSDSNIKVGTDPTKPDYVGNHAGTAFLELQFYPPGYVQQFAGFSCAATKWCSAMTIDGLSDDQTQNNNADCLERAGEEYANFAYLTLNGVPQGPPDPLNFQFVQSGTPGANVLYMSPGDKVTVTIQDTVGGLQTIVHDDTTGQTGSMVASSANGFGHPLFQPSSATCHDQLYTYHPMYSTSTTDTTVPWAAHTYNVAFSDEIGHFEFCGGSIDANGNCHQRTDNFGDSDDDFCFPGSDSLLIKVNACLDADTDFDGSSYGLNWPGTSPNPTFDALFHPQSFVVSSPLTNGQNYPKAAFETDLPAIEFQQGCDIVTGANCTNPPQGAQFYPFYSTTVKGGTCAWREGGRFMPGTTNDFGGSSAAEYGSLLFGYAPSLPGFPAGTYTLNYHNSLPNNPCPSNGSLP